LFDAPVGRIPGLQGVCEMESLRNRAAKPLGVHAEVARAQSTSAMSTGHLRYDQVRQAPADRGVPSPRALAETALASELTTRHDLNPDISPDRRRITGKRLEQRVWSRNREIQFVPPALMANLQHLHAAPTSCR